MVCIKCKKETDNTPFCPLCGADQNPAPKKKNVKKRGNQQGTVYRRGSTWQAEIRRSKPRLRKTRSGFQTKTAALAWINAFDVDTEQATTTSTREFERKTTTFKELFDEFLPTHKRSRDTLNCYKAAVKYFSPLWDVPFRDIEIEDLQDCIDECPKGKRTKENMKALASLLYSYAIPRRGLTADGLNLAHYLKIYEDAGEKHISLPVEFLPKIKKAIGTVPYAEHIYCLCYTGFRASAFLKLRVEDYNAKEGYIRGGSKTEAGIDRIVTLSPKVIPYFEKAAGNRKTGYLWLDMDREPMTYGYFRENCFYSCLEQIGIDNPIIDINGRTTHTYTPHSCRRTFATLLKNVKGADKDKLELIGHTSEEMLRYYQDVNAADLRAITDQI